MSSDSDARRVAIACQGGGSHTAFTAGVLGRLLGDAALEREVDIVGFSGTSGGAVCALLAWYGREHPDESPDELLADYWSDLAAEGPLDRAANGAIRWASRLERAGVPLPDVSPYQSPAASWGRREFLTLLERHVDFAAIPELLDGNEPALLISAIDVLSGEFEIFREDDLSPEAILASAAIPFAFRAVEVNGSYYWDGLFSKNPPVKDFVTNRETPDPDEIWVIKINPERRDRVPKSADGIADRRNELSGNKSLSAEISFVEHVNEWIEAGYLPEKFTHTEIERIRFGRPDLHWRTKLEREPEFIESLYADGEAAAEAFLAER
ncbi:patatin-like phospholipase family protein [Natronolimnohabitans innermongolicus]|uniref:Putative esterase of the alpha-beta hydrolase superfamily protein n=1 Tax=Natronolimnohabitans innermongolicus JCM 12255 TaxID=1227499 RepID=L9XC61_9EURY|nr:patatin-like phospholipase family protein [Natronolimnohabitans innermongolicus]ELY59001.1 putative esterase of the alpha-beta hydrolase superfamily protein [Natronolimnohabitans innermongolicus JCM 12255]